MSDRLVRFPGASWQDIEALPQPLRWTVQRVIFHLLEEPVPTLADPFPADDPLPGAYELRLSADDVTIWYTVTVHERQVLGRHGGGVDTKGPDLGFRIGAGEGNRTLMTSLEGCGPQLSELLRSRSGYVCQ